MTTAPTTHTQSLKDHPPTDPAPAPHGPTEEQIEVTAHAAHEAMYGYCRALKHNNISHFNDSPDWMKEQARDMVRAVVGGKKIDLEKDGKGEKLSKTERVKRQIAAAVIPPVLAALETED